MSILGGPPPPQDGHGARSTYGVVSPIAYVPVAKDDGSVLDALSQGTRVDGRRFEEARPCRLHVGAIPNATGSAYVEQGSTKVIAGVTVRGSPDHWQNLAEATLNLDFQFVAFCSRFVTSQESETRARLYKSILLGAIESIVEVDKHENVAIDVHILVLEDDGAALTVALIAASLALSDAGVETLDLAAGATVHYCVRSGESEGCLLLDCSGDEERAMPQGNTVLHIGICPSKGSLCMLHSVGPLAPVPFEQMVLLAKDTSEAVGEEMERCLDNFSEARAAKRLTAPKPD